MTNTPWLAAAAAAALLAGCAAPPAPAPRESEITVTRIERLRWDLEPEPGLYRVRFGPALSLEMRREAERMSPASFMDYLHAEIQVMEREAARELVARRLCTANARIVLPVEPNDGNAPLTAVFRCGVSLF